MSGKITTKLLQVDIKEVTFYAVKIQAIKERMRLAQFIERILDNYIKTCQKKGARYVEK